MSPSSWLVCSSSFITKGKTLFTLTAIKLTLTGRCLQHYMYDSDGKKVSRAESWRYESSVYVKQQANPRFHNHVRTASDIGAGASTPLSSTPLLRNKNMLEVDVVKTSLQTDHGRHRQRHNTYHGTAPAPPTPTPSIVETPSHYRQPLDCIRPGNQTCPTFTNTDNKIILFR